MSSIKKKISVSQANLLDFVKIDQFQHLRALFSSAVCFLYKRQYNKQLLTIFYGGLINVSSPLLGENEQIGNVRYP